MKATIVLRQKNEQTGEKVELPFTVMFNKHNRDDVMGTLANEICEGLRLLKKWKAKGGVKSTLPCTVFLKMGDIALDTADLRKTPEDKRTILKGLSAKLKINAGNPKSEADFFGNLNDMFAYMVKEIGFMNIQHFMNTKYAEYDVIKEERKIAKEFKDAMMSEENMN